MESDVAGAPPRDASWRLILGHRIMMADFLRLFAPGDVASRLDMDSLEPCPDVFITPVLGERRADLVWRARWKDRKGWLHILVEHQSAPDFRMAERVSLYTILNRQKAAGCAIHPDDADILVLPVVVYTGRRPWAGPTRLEDLVGTPPDALASLQPRQEFILVALHALDRTKLGDGRNLAAQVIRLETASSLQDVREIVSGLIALLRDQEHAALRRDIAAWLGRVVLRRLKADGNVPEFYDLQEVGAMLEESVARWIEEWKEEAHAEGLAQGHEQGHAQGLAQGHAEGLEEGMVKGENRKAAEIARNMIRAGMDPAVIVSVTGLSREAVERIANAPDGATQG